MLHSAFAAAGGAGGGQRACAGGARLEAAPRLRRCRAAAAAPCAPRAEGEAPRAEGEAPRADGVGIALVEVQQEGDGRAVRAALEALRNKRRERELVGFYSMPTVESRLMQSSSSDPIAALKERHQHDMTQLRTRLNGRLSKASAYARHCDRAIKQRDAAVALAHEELTRLRTELGALVTLAADAAVDPKQASYKFVSIAERAKALAAGVEASMGTLDAHRVRALEISWTGMAEDVRVMGSFDGWTHGVPLSPEEPGGGYSTFTATLKLLPGSYEIKFLVDSQWRVAAGWPLSGEGLAANNVLCVGEDMERDGVPARLDVALAEDSS